MSYLEHKSRAFRDAGDVPDVVRKRSDGRLKNYPSVMDARAWCNSGEDQRQYILDLIKGDHEKCNVGKYVPIDVLIRTLLANKNADIARLREQVEELQALLDIYSKLDLTEDQKNKLNMMKSQMGKAGGRLVDMSPRETTKPRLGESTSTRVSSETSEPEEDTTTTTISFPGKHTGESSYSALDQNETLTDTTRTTSTGGSRPCGALRKKETETDTTCTTPSTGESRPCGALRKKQTETDTTRTTPTGESRPCGALRKKETETDTTRTTSSTGESRPCGALGKKKSGASSVQDYDGMSTQQLKDQLKQRDEELAAKQIECDKQNEIARKAIEKLEKLKGIMEERDTLKKRLQDSYHEIETLKKNAKDPCVNEIAELENEIDRLRTKGQLSAEEEAEIIRKEVDVLKKYCARLCSIQEENQKLKFQLQRLQEVSGIPIQTKGSTGEVELPQDAAKLREMVKDLQQKVSQLSTIMEERDRFKERVKQLEAELLKYGDLPNEIEVFKQKSQMLDDVVVERNDLQKRLERLRGTEEELIVLKKKADRVDELERLLKAANGEITSVRRNSAVELQSLRSASVGEVEKLKCRAKEAELLKIERDRLKARIDELTAIEAQYKQLIEKTKGMDAIKAERNTYKLKYEQLLGLECECDVLRAQVDRFKQLDKEREQLLQQIRDCENCIADQEDEIKKLVTHIDRLSQGTNQQQDRMQKALSGMRVQLDKKNNLIASSEEQLAGVQDQLKCTIAEVSCETTCLRARIEDLEDELKEKDNAIQLLSEELQNVLSNQEDTQRKLKVDSKTGDFGDEHLQLMLQQSKCAVTKVAEELTKQYGEWDSMQSGGQDRPDKSDDLDRDQGSSEGKFDNPDDLCGGPMGGVYGEKPPCIADCANEKVQADTDQRQTDEGESDLFLKYTEEKRTSLKLSRDIDELQALIMSLTEQLQAANATIARLREQLSGTENLDSENKTLRRLSTEVQDVAKEQIEELSRLLKEAKERIATLEASPDLDAELSNLKSEKAQLEGNIKRMSESAAAGTTLATAQISQQNEQLQKDKRAVEDENANLRKQLEELKKSSGDASRLADLLQERDDLLAQTENQKKEIAQMISSGIAPISAEDGGNDQKEKEDLQNMIKSLQSQIKQMESGAPVVTETSDSTAINQALAKLTRQLEEEQAKAAVAEAALTQLQAEGDGALLKEIERLKQKVNELEKSTGPGLSDAECQKKIKELESLNADLLKAAAGDDSALINQFNELQQKLKSQEEENNKLNQKLNLMDNVEAISSLKDESEPPELFEQQLNLNSQDQIILNKMKQGYEDRIRKLEEELAKQKKECTDTIQTLKNRYDRDVKNINSKYNDGIAKLQGSHEEILKDVSSEYEKEVETLRTELRKSNERVSSLEVNKARSGSHASGGSKKDGELTVKTLENVNINSIPEGVCMCGSQLANIFQKILRFGLESLSFEELQFVHTKICEATTSLLKKYPGIAGRMLPPPELVPILTEVPKVIERVPSMQGMENDLVKKQKQAVQKVGALQMAVKLEKMRLEELKRILEEEKKRNNELIGKIGVQSRVVANMEVERDIMRKQTSFHEEKLTQLLCECETERNRVKNLEDGLHKAKQKQRHDSQILESMRIKLEKSLNNEMVLKMQLDQRLDNDDVAPCKCHTSGKSDSDVVRQAHHTHTSSFYTELTVQDIRKKRNFVHHCCMKHSEYPASVGGKSSSQVASSRRSSDVDDI